MTVVELDCRGIAGVDGEGQASQISLTNPIEGEFHEIFADPQAADGGGQAQINQFHGVNLRRSHEQQNGGGLAVAAEEKPIGGIKFSSGLMAGDHVLDVPNAVEGGAIEAVLVAGDDGGGKRGMICSGVGLELKFGAGRWGLGRGRKGSKGPVQIDQFGHSRKAVIQVGIDRRLIRRVEQNLGQLDVPLGHCAADRFDGFANGSRIRGSRSDGGGKIKHGSAGVDHWQNGPNQSAVGFDDLQVGKMDSPLLGEANKVPNLRIRGVLSRITEDQSQGGGDLGSRGRPANSLPRVVLLAEI